MCFEGGYQSENVTGINGNECHSIIQMLHNQDHVMLTLQC